MTSGDQIGVKASEALNAHVLGFSPVGYVPMTVETLNDMAGITGVSEASIFNAVSRWASPWEWPDRNPFPRVDPVPRFTRLIAGLLEARWRVVHAALVLRHGEFYDDERYE